jgi:inner membrane protein
MDTLTHALSGALLARATAPLPPGDDQLPLRQRMWIGAAAAAFPDTDFIVRFIDPLVFLTTHRGVTHSIVLLPLWAMLLAFLFSNLSRGRYHRRAYIGICAAGIGIHILGDLITSFGTMVFAPISSLRVELPFTFIIDPIFTGIIAVGLIAAAVWKTKRRPAVIALAVLVTYVGFEGLIYQRALGVGTVYARGQGLEAADVRALPQPLSPFNRMVVVTHEDTYHIAYINLFREDTPRLPEDAGFFRRLDASYRPSHLAQWQRVARFGEDKQQAVFAERIWRNDAFAAYRQFTMFPALYRIDNNPGATCLWFHDLRFALAGRPNPFRYGLCNNGEKEWRISRLEQRNGRDLIHVLE